MEQSVELRYLNQWTKNPSFTLINSPYFPFIMAFLDRTFLQRHIKSVPEGEMVVLLQDYLDEMQEKKRILPDNFHCPDRNRTAEDLLKNWCDQTHRWLYHDVRDSGSYSLTPVTHQVMDFTENSNDGAFNSYRTQNLLSNIVEKARELAIGGRTDPASHIHYHEEQIARLEYEKQRHKAEIERFSKMAEDENVSIYSMQEKQRIYEYITGLLRQLRLEVSRYIAMTEDSIEDFFSKAAEITRREADEDVIQIFLNHIKEIRDNPDFRSINKIRLIMGSREKMEQLSEDTQTINNDLLGNSRRYQYTNSIVQQVRDAFQEIIQANDHLVHANNTIRQMLKRENLQEQRYIEKLLQRLDFVGRSLRDAAEQGNGAPLRNGIPPLQFTTFEFIGRPLVLRKEIKEKKSFGIVRNQRKNAPKVIKIEPPINRELLQEHVLDCLQKYSVITLGTIAKEYPITRGLDEVNAYLTIMNKMGSEVISNELECVRADDQKSGRPVMLIGGTVMLRRKEKMDYAE